MINMMITEIATLLLQSASQCKRNLLAIVWEVKNIGAGAFKLATPASRTQRNYFFYRQLRLSVSPDFGVLVRFLRQEAATRIAT